MAKKEGKEKKNSAGYITVVVILCVILAALIALATLATLGYFGSSSEDESSEVEKGDSVTSSSEDLEDEEKDESHTHSYESSYTAPTCTQDGSITLTCTECGDTYTEKIDKLGHDWDNVSYGHDEVEHWLVCSRCGAQGEKETHTISTTITDPTCEGAGLKTDICTVCGYHESAAINALGHAWNDGVVTKEATCKEAGEKTYTCNTCGATYTEVISATGKHTFDNGEISKMPTCLEDGEVTFTCTVCSDSYTVVISSTSLGHDYSVIVNSADLGIHYTVCSRCGEVEEGSASLCTYAGNKYGYDDSGSLHNVCDVCGGLSVETVETPTANSDGTYNYTANSGSSLASALDALASASETTDGAQSTITLTEDLTLDEDSESQFEIGASNVILDGGEDGVTLHDGHELKISGDNVTLKNLTLDGSDIKTEQDTYAHAIEINGNDVTLENCTIIGGEATTYTSAVLIDLVPGCGDDGLINITGCDITGAFRGIYVIDGGSVHLSVSDTYIESTYAFNETGSTDATFDFTNSTLMGWTSYATTGDVNFTNCTLGFCAVGEGWTSYGYVRPYHAKTTFTDCYFESVISRQARLEDYNLIWYSDPVVSDRGCNFTLGCMGSDCTNIFLNCTLDDVVWDSQNNAVISQSTYVITKENIINIIDTDFYNSTYGTTNNLSVDGVCFFSYQSLLSN